MRELKLICVVAMLTACSGGGKVSMMIEKDQGSADWWQPDAGVADKGGEMTIPDVELPPDLGGPDLAGDSAVFGLTPDPGEFGYPCESDDQCNSGFCVVTPNGEVCTVLCEDECPAGWECALHKPSLPDQTYICVPSHVNLCRPCLTNADCEVNGTDSGSACLDYGPGGNFCGGECESDGECPEGYGCLEAIDSSGQELTQCMQHAGECECAQWFVDEQAATECFVENEWGTCAGERVCLAEGLTDCSAPGATEELCNGLDDDCDGEVDEALDGQDCTVQNDNGACAGTQQCVGGNLTCDAETPLPESCDGVDNNCDGAVDEGYPDSDGDGLADCLETDADDDGVADIVDNCPAVKNPGQEDFDLDGDGDACDLDDDNDLVGDDEDCEPLNGAVHPGAEEVCNGIDDNCDGEVDEGFEDADGDGIPDCLDNDADGDGIPNNLDNCKGLFNPQQLDLDEDGLGDACDDDTDGDGVDDSGDNCVGVKNPGQEDYDEDDEGDACDDDDDDDGVPDLTDNCHLTFNPGQEDSDLDGKGDACEDDTDGDAVPDGEDNCVVVKNPEQLDLDGDGTGDVCDDDDDGDGIADGDDNCAEVQNPEQLDMDGDGLGDACDTDSDGDGIPDGLDNCEGLFNPLQLDLDLDGLGDACDEDLDGDGHDNDGDNCPLVVNLEQDDLDEDGVGDACDDDTDGDGDADLTDCAPFDWHIGHGAKELCDGVDNNCELGVDEGYIDTDLDSFKDCVDKDDDNDGDPDDTDCAPLDPAVHALAEEVCNLVDDNCDGQVDEGFGTLECGVGQCFHQVEECLDGASQVCNPFAGATPETCDGEDNDCDGEADEDMGTTTCGLGECLHTVDNCVGGIPQICSAEEGAGPEECDGKDNDCNGLVDDGLGTLTCGFGICDHIVLACLDGVPVECDPFQGALVEVCNGADDDCDGELDNDLGTTTCGLGECEHTIDNCADGIPRICDAEEGAGVETCDGLDNDCDGEEDEELGSTTCGLGACEHSVENCVAGEPQVCDPMEGAVDEECGDAIDNSCDGVADEGCAESCQDWLDLDPEATDGFYLIDADGAGPAPAFEAWCNMTIDGGGWTRFFWLDAAYPNNKDPFEFDVWECNNNSSLCRAGIPKNVAPKDLLVVDKTDGAHAAWHFAPANSTSNAILGALRDRTPVCAANGQVFNPYLVSSAEQFCGTGVEGGCDSFFYTSGTCGAGKTVGGSWGVNWDGDTGCYAAAFKFGDVSTPCCGCVMNGSDWAFLNYTAVKDESGELYYR